MGVPVGGGAAFTLASNQATPRHLAVDGTHAYWTAADATLRRVAIEGGAVELLAAGLDPYGLALDATSVYWGGSVTFDMTDPDPGGNNVPDWAYDWQIVKIAK